MQSRYKYFPISAAQSSWGLYITCAGHGRSEPNAVFPSHAHPDQYFFSWKVGRILREWQIILICDGEGTVEFKNRRCRVHKGSLMVLPPGCWHRYRPNPKTGWTTLWIGFGGELAARILGGAGFGPDGEVRDIEEARRLHQLFAGTVSYILDNGHTAVYSAAARIHMLVAAIIEDCPSDKEQSANADLVRRAQTFISENSAGIVDFASLAESLGIDYRSFRYLFKKETGFSPLQYQLAVRLTRAKNLLRSSDIPVAEIGSTLGFNSTWYFSRFFRQQTGMPPITYRKKHTGE